MCVAYAAKNEAYVMTKWRQRRVPGHLAAAEVKTRSRLCLPV